MEPIMSFFDLINVKNSSVDEKSETFLAKESFNN